MRSAEPTVSAADNRFRKPRSLNQSNHGVAIQGNPSNRKKAPAWKDEVERKVEEFRRKKGRQPIQTWSKQEPIELPALGAPAKAGQPLVEEKTADPVPEDSAKDESAEGIVDRSAGISAEESAAALSPQPDAEAPEPPSAESPPPADRPLIEEEPPQDDSLESREPELSVAAAEERLPEESETAPPTPEPEESLTESEKEANEAESVDPAAPTSALESQQDLDATEEDPDSPAEESPPIIVEPEAHVESVFEADSADFPDEGEFVSPLDAPLAETVAIERDIRPGESDDSAHAAPQETFTFREKAQPMSLSLEMTNPPSVAPLEGDDQDSSRSETELSPSPYEEDFPDDAEDSAGEEEWVSREIFFSRFLAGLVDLLLPSFLGLAFSFAASQVLGFEYFSNSTIEIAAVLSLMFYLSSSIFFLALSGQTPGMHLTGLRLLHQDSEELPLGAIVLRVVVLLPTVATVIGLLWGPFDQWGRCLHDRVSQTRVVADSGK